MVSGKWTEAYNCLSHPSSTGKWQAITTKSFCWSNNLFAPAFTSNNTRTSFFLGRALHCLDVVESLRKSEKKEITHFFAEEREKKNSKTAAPIFFVSFCIFECDSKKVDFRATSKKIFTNKKNIFESNQLRDSCVQAKILRMVKSWLYQ